MNAFACSRQCFAVENRNWAVMGFGYWATWFKDKQLIHIQGPPGHSRESNLASRNIFLPHYECLRFVRVALYRWMLISSLNPSTCCRLCMLLIPHTATRTPSPPTTPTPRLPCAGVSAHRAASPRASAGTCRYQAASPPHACISRQCSTSPQPVPPPCCAAARPPGAPPLVLLLPRGRRSG